METSLSSIPLSSKLLDGLCPTALSVDVTNKCNLKCQHCFWIAHSNSLPMATNKNIINHVKAALKKYPSITNITWYGGEPLIDKETMELIEPGLSLKRNNLVITNGYFPIPDWRKNVHFVVSVDGTEKIHDELRGLPGLYKKIKENISKAIKKNIPVVAAIYCLNAKNIDCVPTFIEEWIDTGLYGIAFTTYMPLDDKDPSLILNDKQRDKMVDLLIKMKRKYKNFIGNTECMIELIRTKYGKELAENCPMDVHNKDGKVYSLHMCNDGSVRIPCAYGIGASYPHCLYCRSITKVALYAGEILHDRASFLSLLRMYHSKPYSKEKKIAINLTP